MTTVIILDRSLAQVDLSCSKNETIPFKCVETSCNIYR